MSDQSGERELTPLQEQILIRLLQGKKIADIVVEVDIAKSTYYRTTRDQFFQDEYRRRKIENFNAAFTQMQSSLSEDVKLLEKVRDDRTETALTRMKAVSILLEYAVNSYEREMLEQRIAEIEKRLGITVEFRT